MALDIRRGDRRADGPAVAPARPRRVQALRRRAVRQLGPYHRATMPAGKAILVVLIALLLGGLLNVRSLTEAAERQPPGLGRDVSLVAVWPFQQISGLLGLDQPRDLLAQRLGRSGDAGQQPAEASAAASEAPGAPTEGDVAVDAAGNPVDPLSSDALAVAAALAGREAIDPSIADAVAIPAEVDPDAPTAQLPDRLTRTFTAEDPLRVAVVGDSLTEQLGPSLIAATDRPGVLATTTHEFAYSSGLSRPDFYDWPAQIASLAESADPDLWVVMLGANDAQDVRDDEGRFRQIGSEEWEAVYRQRVGRLMDLMTADERAVIWVGQPIMRDPDFDESMAYVSDLYRREAAMRSQVSFVDARRVFAGPDGGYADYLPGVTGQLSQMRLPDGIHLTRTGAERLARQVLPLLPVVTDPDLTAVPAS